MKILLLGGRYFLGKSIIEHLLIANHDLTVISLQEPQVSQHVKWLKINRDDKEQLEKNLKDQYFDAVVDNIAMHPNSVSVLLDVVGKNIKKYILTSTVDVYKNNQLKYVTPKDANLSFVVDDPKIYQEVKITSENVLLSYREPIDKIIIRPSIIVGRYDNVATNKDLPFAISRSLHYPARALDKYPLLISKNSYRPFNLTYVDDVSKAILLLLNTENVNNKIFNISGDESLSCENFVRTMLNSVGFQNDIISVNHTILPEEIKKYRTPYNYDYEDNVGNNWNLFDTTDIKALGWTPTPVYDYSPSLFDNLSYQIKKIQPIRKVENSFTTGYYYSRRNIKVLNLYRDDGLDKLSEIGVGTYKGQSNEVDDLEYTNSINYLIENGVNVIDTAINYRNERSEKIIGDILQNNQKVFLISKGGYASPDLQKFLYPAETPMYHSMRVSYIDESLTKSILNIKTKINCYLIHNVENGLSMYDKDTFYKTLTTTFTLLEQRVRDGYIDSYGISTWNGLRINEAEPTYLDLNMVLHCAQIAAGKNVTPNFKYIELPYNPVMHEAGTLYNQTLGEERVSTLDYALAKNLKVFASCPMNRAEVTIGYKNLSPVITSLNFARSHPSIAVCLPGIRQIDHAKEIVEGMKDLPKFTKEECDEIIKLYN